MDDLSVLLVSTYPPRHDGLATFASDLAQNLVRSEQIRVRVIAIDPNGEALSYGKSVIGRIQQGNPDSYTRAADMVERVSPDIVCLQHEYGLWGAWSSGLDEDYTVPFMRAIRDRASTPIIVTLHTVRPSPERTEREALRRIVAHSSATVVMARTAAMILVDVYDTSPDTIVRIPHGVPVVERRPRRDFKRRLGVGNRTIFSTIGMLDRRKGIEHVIAAMPQVVTRYPDALYLIVGETHPETRKLTGETYRNELHALVRDLGLHDHVRFVNYYLTDREIVDYFQASDIYVTPYLDREQITSGTLAFAVGTGRAIVSTPYPHAAEALAEGRGLIAEFQRPESLANCILLLLDDPRLRRGMEERTAAYGSHDAWPSVSAQYASLARRVASGASLRDLLAVQPDVLSV